MVNKKNVNKKSVNKKADQKKASAAALKVAPQVVEHIGIVRNDTLRRFYDPTASKIEAGDQLIVVRRGQGRVEGLRNPQD